MNLLKIELYKSINIYTIILVIYSALNFLIFFREGRYVRDIEYISGVVNFMPFMYFYFLFAALLVLSVTRDINNKVIVKHFADGMSRINYFFGKVLFLVAANLVFLIISTLLLLLIAVYYSVGYETLLNSIFSFSHFSMLFVSMLYFGLLGYLYAFIVKNSLISVLLIIGQTIIEITMFYIGNLYKVEVFNYLPFALCRDLIDKSSSNNLSTSLFLLMYIAILLFLIRIIIYRLK